MTNPKEME